MGKNGDDRKGKQKASSEKQASAGKTTGKQQHTNGSPFRLPERFAYMSEHVVSWGERMSTTRGNDVPPGMSSTVPVWNINDRQPTTNAIDQSSRGQAAAGVPVAASSDLRAREDNDIPEGSSANSTPYAPEIRGEEATSSRIPGSNPSVHDALPTPADHSSRWLSPVPLPALHPHSRHTALDIPDSPRFHPYRPLKPRHSSRQVTQLEESHVSMSGGANVSHSSDIPQDVVTDAQVSSTAAPLPQICIHADTGAFYWPGTMDPAALGGAVVQEEALGLDITVPPVLPQETSFSGQNAVAGPSFQPLKDPLTADHHYQYHPGNWDPCLPSGPVAGPSENEEPPAKLGPLEVPWPFAFPSLDDWPLQPQDGSPPPPPSGSQWQW